MTVFYIFHFSLCTDAGSSILQKYKYDCQSSTNQYDLVDSVLNYAEYCQIILKLDNWPAQSLCTEMANDAAFFALFTDYCDPACYFGSKDGGTECICNTGYWNTSCDQVCPGGISNPCSGYGSCDMKTGSCDCPANRQGSDDCSNCTDGWMGSSCDIAVNELNGTKSIAMTRQLGHMTNLDGLSFIIRDPAEYTLLTMSNVLMIEGKLISCHQNYTCFTFISTRIGDSTKGYTTITTKASNQYTDKPKVYIEDQENSLDSPLYFSGFKTERPNSDNIKITIGDDINILIRQQGQYLTLEVEMAIGHLSLTSGLLGGSGETSANSKQSQLLYRDIYSPSVCMYSGAIQSASNTEIMGYTLAFSNVVLNQNMSMSSELNFSRFVPPSCDNFIYYPTTDYQLQKIGGFSLNFFSTVVTTYVDLYTSSGPNITFDFSVKKGNVSGDGGVLFSFSHSNLFMIESAESLEVTYDSMKYPTNLTLETGKWNKIVVMYYGELGDLDMYVFNSTGYIERRSVLLPTGIFNSPGTLSLGHWLPPSSGEQMTSPTALQGQIDNFLIWKIPIEPNIIVDIYQMNPLDIQKLLHSAWLFDDGQGQQTSDFLNGQTFELPTMPWVPPGWIPSDLYYKTITSPGVIDVFFTNTNEEAAADDLCKKITNNTYSECNDIPVSMKQISYSECMQVYSTTKDLASVNNVILNYGRMCQVSLDLPLSPVLTLCDSMEVNTKENSGCQKTCLFGEEQADGSCNCTYGYIGSTCSEKCPGGSDTPCSNHGTCDNNGVCSCDWNWDASSDCGTCTTGMKGPECDIMYAGSNLGTTAYATSQGDYMGFNGYQVNLDELTGTFFAFLEEGTLSIEAYQVSCQFGACVIGLSITTSDSSIVILPSGEQDIPPIIYKDNVKINYDTVTALTASVNLEMESYAKLKLTVKTPQTNTITVTAQEQWLDFALDINSAICQAAEGILGNCNDASSPYTSMTHSELVAHIDKSFRSEQGTMVNTLATVYGVDVNENAGFALSFNKTSSQSKQLSYKDNATFNSNEFSLGVFFKPHQEGGVIMSYSKDKTFTIYSTDPITMQSGSETITTSISPGINEWNQLIITMDGENNQMHLYHYGSNASMTYQIIDKFIPDLFAEGGQVSLADWNPSTTSDKHLFTDAEIFVGEIEEISIWKDPIPVSMITQAESLNVKGAGFLSNVSTLWSFSEGFGNVASDDVLSNDIEMPTFPWQTPQWIASDLKLKDINPDSENKVETKQDVKDFCEQFFDSAAVASACGSVLQQSRDWFKQQCIILGSSSSDTDDGMNAMVSFIMACEAQGGTTSSLFTEMCTLNGTIPFWVMQECNDCGFGYKGSDGTCLCYYGYWGTNCESTCPNGVVEPCNNHGTCDTGGNCQCNGHWTGATCDSCGAGWEGDECVVMPTGQPANQPTLVSQINNYGQMVTFDGYLVDLSTPNIYKLFGHSGQETSVYAHMSSCNDTKKTHYCLIDIMFETNDVIHYIRASKSFDQNKVTVFTSTGETPVFDNTNIGDVELSIPQANFLKVKLTNIDLELDIISIENGLVATMTYPNAKWASEAASIEGLLSSCDTKTSLQLAGCESATRMNICNKVINSTNAGSCVQNISYHAVNSYLNKHAANNADIDTYLDRQYIITGPSCLQFSGSGIFADNFELPTTSAFTTEFHVKPTAANGPILTYHKGDDFITFVNYKSGLAVIKNDNPYPTGIELERNKWNQVSLAIDRTNDRIQVYVTHDSGETTVKELAMNLDVFTNGGTLTVGQIGAGVTTLAPIGQFNGYIDEIRMWTRPNNPSIVKNNWRKDVSEKTPDLFAAWSFSEGTGYLSSDMKNQNMYPVSFDSPPSWASSDLELSKGVELNLPQLTTASPYSSSVDTAKCDTLLKSSKITTPCAGLENLISTMYDQCLTLVLQTEKQDLAEVLLLSTAEYCKPAKSLSESPAKEFCNDLETYKSYIIWHGVSCDEECLFGTTDSGECICDDAHWGASCTETCSLGTDGSCNLHGECNGTNGYCTCSPHWLGTMMSTTSYWRTFSVQNKVDSNDPYFNCSECTTGMYGENCEFVVQEPVSEQTYAVGILMGTYITTLDGASYKIITPGTNNIYYAAGVSCQVLFFPCDNDVSCRHIKELSVMSGGQTVSVLKSALGLQAVHIGGSTTLEYPSITTVSDIEVKWNVSSQFVRLTVGEFSVLVSDSNIGLICRFKVGVATARSATGLLGNTDTTWYNDLISPDDPSNSNMEFVTSQLSTSYTGSWTKSKFGSSLTSVHTYYENRYKNLSTSGYMLHLTTETLSFSKVYSTQDISEFTISFWSRIENSNITQTLMRYQMIGQNLTMSVINGLLQVEWGKTLSTNIMYKVDTWNYIALTWKSSNGQVMIYRIANDGQDFKYKALSNVHLSSTFNVDSISLYGNANNALEIDMLRMWKTAKEFDTVLNEKSAYTNDIASDTDLLILSKFDEGTGSSSSIDVATGSGTTSISGTISKSNNGTIAKAVSKAVTSTDDVWSPSDIPTISLYTSADVTTDSVNSAAMTACIAMLSNPDINKTCGSGDITSLTNFFIEACLADYANVGGNATIYLLLENLIYYCQATFNFDECEIKEYFDYCTTEEEEPSSEGLNIMIIIAAVCGLILLLAIAIAFCWCCGVLCFKKHKVARGDEDSDDEDWGNHRAPSVMSDRSILTARNVGLDEDILFGNYSANAAAMAPAAYNFTANFDEKAKKTKLKAGKPLPSVSIFDAEADESIPLKTDSSLFTKPKLLSDGHRPKSPYVQPGSNYEQDNADIFSPFQPQTKTQSFSFANRGFSPDEADNLSPTDSRKESVASTQRSDSLARTPSSVPKPSVEKISIMDSFPSNTRGFSETSSNSLSSRENSSTKINVGDKSNSKPRPFLDYVPEYGISRQAVMNNRAPSPFYDKPVTKANLHSRHTGSISPLDNTGNNRRLRSRHTFDTTVISKEGSYISSSSMLSDDSKRRPSMEQSLPSGKGRNDSDNDDFTW